MLRLIVRHFTLLGTRQASLGRRLKVFQALKVTPRLTSTPTESVPMLGCIVATGRVGRIVASLASLDNAFHQGDCQHGTFNLFSGIIRLTILFRSHLLVLHVHNLFFLANQSSFFELFHLSFGSRAQRMLHSNRIHQGSATDRVLVCHVSCNALK